MAKVDVVATPVAWTRALVEGYPPVLGAPIWEPACGTGALSEELTRNGCNVCVSTDKMPQGYGWIKKTDFLKQAHAPRDCTAIVSEPPERLASKFVEHALALPGISCVALLLPATFGNDPRHLAWVNRESSLWEVVHLVSKVPTNRAWYVWHPGHRRPAYTGLQFVQV